MSPLNSCRRLTAHGLGDGAQVAARNAVLVFQDGAVFFKVEQAQWRLVYRAALDGVERHALGELFELFGNGRFATAHRAQQVENLLLLFETLGGMAEVGHHLLDDLFHAVKLAERRIDANHLVTEDARQAGVVAGVDDFRFTNRHQHALGRAGIGQWLTLADIQVLLDGEFFFAGAIVTGCVVAEDVRAHGVTLLLEASKTP